MDVLVLDVLVVDVFVVDVLVVDVLVVDVANDPPPNKHGRFSSHALLPLMPRLAPRARPEEVLKVLKEFINVIILNDLL